MQVLIIHDTETEEIIGMVTPLGVVDFDKFCSEVWKTWKAFNDDDLDEDYTIEDFVDYHNENSEMEIDWVVSDYIQL